MEKRTCVKLIQVLFLILCITPFTEAQLLDRVIRRSKQKIGREVENLVVEKVSDAIARKIYRSMSDAFDKMLEDAYKQDSAYQANYGDSLAIKYGKVAGSWLDRMNDAADLPDSYTFDKTFYIEVIDKKETNEMKMHFSKSSPILGIEQTEGKEQRFIVIDTEKDVTVMYMEKNGKKTAQAIPNLLGMASTIHANNTNAESEDRWTFKATGKTKVVAEKYTCQEYTGGNSEYSSTFYVSEDLDVNWQSAFENMTKKFAALTYEEKPIWQGVMLESHTHPKKKKKDITSWITKKIADEKKEITNADYEFGSLAMQE